MIANVGKIYEEDNEFKFIVTVSDGKSKGFKSPNKLKLTKARAKIKTHLKDAGYKIYM